MAYTCRSCGKVTVRLYPNSTCQGCYKYFHTGGTVNPLPKPGEIAHDYRGFVVCHICGRAYKRLGSHLRESHGITIAEYKEEFGLCNNAKTTESQYSRHMATLAISRGQVEQLMRSGFNTRVQKGDKRLRFGKKASLQECIDKRNRKKGKKHGDDTKS